MINIPPDYKIINSRAFILMHCENIDPLLLKNTKTHEYAVFCPGCGLRVNGTTDNVVLDIWNEGIKC